MLRYLLYFFIGGFVAATVAYLGSIGRGTLSAFVATLPLMTVLSFLLISREGNAQTIADYGRGLLLFMPAWVCYLAVVLALFERIGILKSLMIGILVYVIGAFITKQLILPDELL
jgi:uncharacterized membrane protein (GlpM family)